MIFCLFNNNKMNKDTKYDFDKGYMIKNPGISKNLLNAYYTDIIKTKKNEKRNNKNISQQLTEPEYKIDTTLINLSYSEKIKKWKENISYN